MSQMRRRLEEVPDMEVVDQLLQADHHGHDGHHGTGEPMVGDPVDVAMMNMLKPQRKRGIGKFYMFLIMSCMSLGFGAYRLHSWGLFNKGTISEVNKAADVIRQVSATAEQELEAVRQLREKGAKAALPLYQRLMPHASRNPAIAGNIASVHLSLGDARGALELLESAHMMAPDDPRILTNLAAAKYKTGDREKATELVQQAIALDPGCGECHLFAASLAEREGRWMKALEHSERFMESAAARGPHGPRVRERMRFLHSLALGSTYHNKEAGNELAQ